MTLNTGKVAKLAGVNVETLRFYEREGILPEPPRRASGYREYPRKMKQNIAVAVLFNFVGMTLAVAGLITPAVAIGVMIFSIFAILLNTLSLTRVDLGQDYDEENASVIETELSAPGMVCEGCSQKITQGLMALDGVQKVIPDVKAKRVHVLHDPGHTNEQRMRETLKKLGYA
ncbi:MerR family DNA-binding transcriptional regulator [Gimesia sp.]|uniref:MerR family DNA-binding transcriptional regulator n=1 Tax=Gimesia sp. TaxID=2024833 RepID=UPI000C3FE4E8|nr:MerR family DNA-binding transcriptional regulator [Gimesia sp.]MAX40149.1 hypothetical protein [Gimesia sp.]HAH45761.1 hypothetical protein [Planctomycetaceae bacterium]HBL46224.1 hypothetical protein [Planctomycetaceae bacterium]|tara:strand:- start:4160 stop:4678 length:519 start_codon:yes stop_codon:yes gene_type:complete